MPKIPDRLVASIRRLQALQADAKEAGNAANRQKTAVKNGFVEFLRAEELPPTARLIVDGCEYGYGPTESTYIPAEKWYRMFQGGKITERQFLEALSIGKAEAKRIIGADQVESISVRENGERSDVRVRELTDDKGEAVRLVVPAAKIPVRTGPKPRRLIPGLSKPQPAKLLLKTRTRT